MPRHISADRPKDEQEQRIVERLSRSRQAPASVVQRSRMIVMSWTGERTRDIASTLGCHPQTVRDRLARFNEEGLAGLQDRARPGRPCRLEERERSQIIALVRQAAPGRLVREADGELWAEDEGGEAHWTLDALTRVVNEQGIQVKRSQIRRILLKEGVRWRDIHPWTTSSDPDFGPKGPRS